MNPVIHYILHKKYYAEVLCVNKDKPKMHCNGKCHLRKEIRQEENDKNSPDKPVPVTNTDKEKFPVLIELKSENEKNNEFSVNSIIYIMPYFKDIYPEIIVPPPENV